MGYRKYDTCFFERYAIIALKTLLGHKFDNLVNEDRPDLQSADGKTLGIEVTRAMEPGRAAAQELLKSMAGISVASEDEEKELRQVVEHGYGYGIHEGKYVGGLEIGYWKNAKPLLEIIRNKVYKVETGFYGDFNEFGLFVFCKDHLEEPEAEKAVRFIMDLERDSDKKYKRLFLFDCNTLYACNLEDGISMNHRITVVPVTCDENKAFYLDSLEY